jgi:hypothetical protein
MRVTLMCRKKEYLESENKNSSGWRHINEDDPSPHWKATVLYDSNISQSSEIIDTLMM